jgi:phage shock protein PspC (stress-responsive transcriptional regulator)
MAGRLTRDTKRAVLGGVAAGFANYFGIDPVLARLAFILLVFFNGAGLLLYLVCWVIMPRREQEAGAPESTEPTPADRIAAEVRQAGEKVVQDLHRSPRSPRQGKIIGGSILVVLGILFLLDKFSWWRWPDWASIGRLWPVILIAIGISMLVEAARGKKA